MQIGYLSKQDAIILLEIINQSLSCDTERQVIQLMGTLQKLLSYGAAVSCLGSFGVNGAIEEMKIVNVDYPEDYLMELAGRGLVAKDPVVIENFRAFRMQYWADTFRQAVWTKETHEIMSLAEDYGISNVKNGCGYGFGVRNRKGTAGSFFCYQGLERSPRTEEILGLLIPHFHAALCRLAGISKTSSPLTTKEVEILKWLKLGKKTWDISMILGISERTVKFHIRNIMHKLDATNRTHAVAIALEQELIDND